jgi:UDP-GlcNAc:undecaprenyl-phosphate/decaprenyl-phosphate GlcNAc-1-phosphate transferase
MLMLAAAVIVLASSAWLTYSTIELARRYGLGTDEGVGVQKFHSHWVPRLGGVPIFVALVTTLLATAWATGTEVFASVALIVCLLPAFAIGLLEDLTRRAGVLSRLTFTMVSAALGWWLLQGRLTRLDIPYVDELLLASVPAAFALTLIAGAGIAHAINIIDGYNGLSGFFLAVIFLSLAWVAHRVDDAFIFRTALLSAASTLGFLAWNFPHGRIFLGDAGAYVLGFLIALLSILLVVRHPQVSAWFPMLLVIHPVWETLFSMYRRARHGFSEMGKPDALHLHSLIYRRVVKRYGVTRDGDATLRRNATTSVYLWFVAILCAGPALLWWDDTARLMACCAVFIVLYGLFYRRLVRFRVPRALLGAGVPGREPRGA